MTRPPFPKESTSRANSIMELIHTDVMGPMKTMSPSGKSYVLTFIDDHSRYTFMYLINQKSQVFSKFKEFVEYVKNQFNMKVKMIRSDGGGEYVSKEFENYLNENGIQYQRTAAYSPEQNGVAERKNRTLMDMTRCLLLDAKLEKKFWGEAIATANYLLNRLPSKAVSKTPYELAFGK